MFEFVGNIYAYVWFACVCVCVLCTGHEAVAKVLMQAGADADVNSKNTNGFTALMAAADKGSVLCYICLVLLEWS